MMMERGLCCRGGKPKPTSTRSYYVVNVERKAMQKQANAVLTLVRRGKHQENGDLISAIQLACNRYWDRMCV